MKWLPLLWVGLMRRRSRTVLTVLSIMVAFLLFGLLQGVAAAFQQVIDGARMDRLYVNNRANFIDPLPRSYQSQIERIPGVSQVTYATFFGGYFRDPANSVFTFAVDPRSYFALYKERVVAPEQLATMTRTRTGAIVGWELAHRQGWKIGDRIPVFSSIYAQRDGSKAWAFDIVGIYDDPLDRSQTRLLLINDSYFDEERTLGKGTVDQYMVGVASVADSTRVAAQIDHLFANSPAETRTQPERQVTQFSVDQLGDVRLFVNLILVTLLGALLFATCSAIAQAFDERTAELAMLSAIGFSQGTVFRLVIAESLLQCLLGGLLGLALAALIFPNLSDFVDVARLPANVVSAGVVLAAGLALAASAIPIWKTARLPVADALSGR